MSVNGRWRYGGATVVALVCAGLVAFTVPSAGARARAVAAGAAACGRGGSSTIFSYGGGTRTISEHDVPACVTGRLTITFAGSAAAGCAAEGLCGYSGTETYAPQSDNPGDINVMTVERHGHRSTTASLTIGGPSSLVTSAVQRTVSNGTTTATASCSDGAGTQQELDGSLFALPVAGGRVTVGLGHGQPALLGSRCAGPLYVDIASVLPSRTISLRALERGERTIDLTGGGTFSAHGLSGTVTSTLALTLGRPEPSHLKAPPKGTTQVHTIRSGTVEYRVARLTGHAVASVHSSATPASCGPLDACGLGGMITVTPGAVARGSVFVIALASHTSFKRLRAELRGAGSPHTKLFGVGLATVRGSVQADLTQDDTACIDGDALRQLDIRLVRVGPRVTVSVSPSESQAADPLRTRCPGPDLGSHLFTSAHLPASVLGRPSFTVALHGVAFGDGPYTVTPRSTLRLTLRRGATRVRVTRIVEPRGAPGVTRAG